MIVMKSDKAYMDLYKKEKTFFVFYKKDMYIVNDKNYRKLSEKEVFDLSHWALAEVEPGKYVYERISNENVYIIMNFPKNINKEVSKKFPKKQKKELIKFFRNRYFMKLVSYIIKNDMNETNLTFIELNKMVLKDMDYLKYEISGKEYFLMEDINLLKVEEMILEYFKEMIEWYGFIRIGRVKIKFKKGKFKIIKDNMNAEQKEKKRLKIIKNRIIN